MDENGMFMNVGDTSILSNYMSRDNFVFMLSVQQEDLRLPNMLALCSSALHMRVSVF